MRTGQRGQIRWCGRDLGDDNEEANELDSPKTRRYPRLLAKDFHIHKCPDRVCMPFCIIHVAAIQTLYIHYIASHCVVQMATKMATKIWVHMDRKYEYLEYHTGMILHELLNENLLAKEMEQQFKKISKS